MPWKIIVKYEIMPRPGPTHGRQEWPRHNFLFIWTAGPGRGIIFYLFSRPALGPRHDFLFIQYGCPAPISFIFLSNLAPRSWAGWPDGRGIIFYLFRAWPWPRHNSLFLIWPGACRGIIIYLYMWCERTFVCKKEAQGSR